MSSYDDELTQLAVDSLLRDARKFKKMRDFELRSQLQKPTPSPNKMFLKNLLKTNESHNKRVSTNSGHSSTSGECPVLKKNRPDSKHQEGQNGLSDTLKHDSINECDGKKNNDFQQNKIVSKTGKKTIIKTPKSFKSVPKKRTINLCISGLLKPVKRDENKN